MQYMLRFKTVEIPFDEYNILIELYMFLLISTIIFSNILLTLTVLLLQATII